MSGQQIEKLLPSVTDIEGWKLISEPQVFEGDKLFELINGGAEIYYEYGFTRVISAHYTDPALNHIQVEVYEMNDSPSAYGIFSITQQSEDWTGQFGNLSAVNSDYISFWESKYYVNLSWSSRQSPEPPALDRLAGMVEQKIPDNGNLPVIVQTFRAMDNCEKTVFLKGNLALSNFYYFDYKDIFKIKEAIACSPGGFHRILIKYPDGQDALEVLASSKSSILNSKRFTDVAMGFQGFSCKDNKGNLILIRQIENFIAILVALDQNISLVPLMDEITLNIENNIK